MPRSRKPSRRTIRLYSESMTEAQYEGYLADHEKRVADELERQIRSSFNSNASHAELAFRAGLSPGTIRNYRKGKRGKRGPLYRTMLLLQMSK